MIFLANPAERAVMGKFALKPVPGTVRVMAFKGLYSTPKRPAEGVVPFSPVMPVVPTPEPTAGATP